MSTKMVSLCSKSLRQKKSPVSVHRSASKPLRWRVFYFFIFLANREIRDTCIRRDQISHIQSMVAKRGKRSYPYVKKLFKTQHGRNPIDPAILAAIGHRFIAKKEKLKMPIRESEVMRAETRNGDFFWGGGLRVKKLINKYALKSK